VPVAPDLNALEDGKPTVALICGLPGSGKTRLARELESELAAVRFDVDEWMIALYGHHMPREELHARLGQLKDLLWKVGSRVVVLGGSVVLDFGFWKRSERLEFADRVRHAGGEPVTYFLDVPTDLLLERLERRNAELPPNTYEVTPEMLRMFAGWFEVPTEEEGIRIVRP
jgi:predicted kinase